MQLANIMHNREQNRTLGSNMTRLDKEITEVLSF